MVSVLLWCRRLWWCQALVTRDGHYTVVCFCGWGWVFFVASCHRSSTFPRRGRCLEALAASVAAADDFCGCVRGRIGAIMVALFPTLSSCTHAPGRLVGFILVDLLLSRPVSTAEHRRQGKAIEEGLALLCRPSTAPRRVPPRGDSLGVGGGWGGGVAPGLICTAVGSPTRVPCLCCGLKKEGKAAVP